MIDLAACGKSQTALRADLFRHNCVPESLKITNIHAILRLVLTKNFSLSFAEHFHHRLLWRLYNLHLAQVMERIVPQDLDTECRIGPLEPVTLGFLMEDYVIHLRHHLAVIEAKGRG